MKTKFFLILFALLLSINALSQVPSGRYFFCESGETYSDGDWYSALIVGDKLYGFCNRDGGYGYLKSCLRRDPSFFTHTKDVRGGSFVMNGGIIDKSKSTSKYTTFKHTSTSVTGSSVDFMGNPYLTRETSTVYVAISRDLQTLIAWSREDASDRHYFTRVDESELLPKESDYDFLR